jgi:hypothetical protein
MIFNLVTQLSKYVTSEACLCLRRSKSTLMGTIAKFTNLFYMQMLTTDLIQYATADMACYETVVYRRIYWNVSLLCFKLLPVRPAF